MADKLKWREVEFEEMTAFAVGKPYKTSHTDLTIDKRNGQRIAGKRWWGYGPGSSEDGHSVEFTDGTAIAVTVVGDYQISDITWASGWTSFWIWDGEERK